MLGDAFKVMLGVRVWGGGRAGKCACWVMHVV